MTTPPESSTTPRESRKLIWAGRIISALPVLLMLMGIVFSMVKPEEVSKGMAQHGYPESSAKWIIATEAACVILYIIPQTAVLGAILLTGYLGGATATHVRVSEAFFMPILVGVFVWLGLYLRDA